MMWAWSLLMCMGVFYKCAPECVGVVYDNVNVACVKMCIKLSGFSSVVAALGGR